MASGGPELPAEEEGGPVLVQNLYLSCDPYMRGARRPQSGPSSNPPPDVAYRVGKVLDSRHAGFRVGDWVWGISHWEEYSWITRPEILFKIHHTDFPLSHYAGVLGTPGLSAYVGLCKICQLAPGEKVFISSAFREVGQVAGQLARLMGCYVVGSAGRDDEVEILKNTLGFHEAFNYESHEDLDAALKRYFPQGIDVYFENVRGKMLDAVLLNMRDHGRIAVSDMTSRYGRRRSEGVHNLIQLCRRQIRMEGFKVSENYYLYPSFLNAVLPCIRQGQIAYVEHIVEGLNIDPAAALANLFSDLNDGNNAAPS